MLSFLIQSYLRIFIDQLFHLLIKNETAAFAEKLVDELL